MEREREGGGGVENTKAKLHDKKRNNTANNLTSDRCFLK